MLFPVLRGLWMYAFQQKGTQKTSELAEQLLALAERQQDTMLRIVAHQVMGATIVNKVSPSTIVNSITGLVPSTDKTQGSLVSSMGPGASGIWAIQTRR